MAPRRYEALMFEELETRWMFAIELDIVALHEFGHSLGLAHYADTPANSIMEAYYNANYNKADLATDVAVLANASDGYNNLLELFTAARIANNTTSWKDSLDATPGNGRVDITYSFVPDGTKLDSNKKSNLFATMRQKISSNDATWQALFTEELQRWASVSTGLLGFTQLSDNGAASGTGAIQNDANFGDIRIGGHRFDGKGGVLAHAYYPPGTNNNSYAGDAHFASEEDWINGDPLTTEGGRAGRFARLVQTPEGYFFHCTFDEVHEHGNRHIHDHVDDHHADEAVHVISTESNGLVSWSIDLGAKSNAAVQARESVTAIATRTERVVAEQVSAAPVVDDGKGDRVAVQAQELSVWSAYAAPNGETVGIYFVDSRVSAAPMLAENTRSTKANR